VPSKIDNPLGIISIDHLEICLENFNSKTIELFYTLGFVKTYTSKDEELYTQGSIHFLCSQKKKTHTETYFKKHGEGVSKISFLVEDAKAALNEAKKRGAVVTEELQEVNSPQGKYVFGSIQGFGDVYNEFIERPKNYFRPWLDLVEKDPKARKLASPNARIDHLTNNVPYGEMSKWVKFYEDIFGMKETRYFDIKGKATGLHSKVVQLANGAVIIPINEPSAENTKSQIQEFLDLHKGPGVQHIALTTTNILSTVGELKERGIGFLKTPDTYYEQVTKRGFDLKEKVEDLKALKLLADGDKEGYLLQIFTENEIGPLFFEFIQRKGHNGFGEGNFQALFDAIELDQKQRGYL
jgi:4-hydroxyphenylpyruvate dioxygenase